MFSKKVKRSSFSLIELLIVIGIMGILTALVLPSFSFVEDDAKDTGCDYNNAGTYRYVTMFKGANGYYPTGFHTGYLDSSGTQLSDDESVACTKGNMGAGKALSAGQVKSLGAAGITKVAYGSDLATALSTSTNVCVIANGDSTWSEDTTSDGTRPSPLTNEVLINGKTLPSYAETVSEGVSGSVVVPLFVAPTIDWEKYYNLDSSGSEEELGESKVGIGIPGKCPWPADGKLRYYICFFKVFEDGSPAKLLGTACPECGSLNGGTF